MNECFVNNIIVTLPTNTKLLVAGENGHDPSKLTTTSEVMIQIPKGYNTIGIIDGQHRVFSYHEGGKFDERIRHLRKKQNLLVTGIIYPATTSAIEKTKFEAGLFLEINRNQTNVQSVLTQAIGLVLKPFASESIATSVISRLNAGGPFENLFAVYYFDKDKVKTASIVSYGLRPIVKLSGNDSFYSAWSNPNKGDLLDDSDDQLLDEYIGYCVSNLNMFLSAVKKNVDPNRWTTDRKHPERLLNVTNINGFINCMRFLVREEKLSDFGEYDRKLAALNTFDFGRFRGRYRQMGEALFEEFFR